MMVDSAGYVICTLIHTKTCSMGFRSGSEKASPVFEHPFCQTMSVQASMSEWSSYPAGREMGIPRNIFIKLGVQYCPECPHTSQSSCFQSQELTDTSQTTRKPPHHYTSTSKLKSQHNAVTKETFPGGIRQTQTRASDCQSIKRD
ncbi:hypothetical protein TNCV_2234331 [Trichonephila clavipes]|nr:hypothetical protein TNCV_2234331 [Trichonephila clavipes]